MPKYMFSGSYTSEGVAGLLAEGGTARRDEAVRIAEMLGGTLVRTTGAMEIQTSCASWMYQIVQKSLS